MSTTSLLPKPVKNLDAHPIFLRICHSPWPEVSQYILVFLRGLFAAYLFISCYFIYKYETTESDGEVMPFKFSNVTYFLQLFYESLAFIWTMMHLSFPHHSNHDSIGETILQAVLSPPRHRPTTLNSQLFSIFYSIANSFPFVSAAIMWFFLLQRSKNNISLLFEQKPLIKFYFVSKFVVSPILAFLEVFVLSSIKPQTKLLAHVFGVTIFSWICIAWVYAGFYFTGGFEWDFMTSFDSWRQVFVACICVTLLVNFFFFFTYLVSWGREMIIKKRRNGYHQVQR